MEAYIHYLEDEERYECDQGVHEPANPAGASHLCMCVCVGGGGGQYIMVAAHTHTTLPSEIIMMEGKQSVCQSPPEACIMAK